MVNLEFSASTQKPSKYVILLHKTLVVFFFLVLSEFRCHNRRIEKDILKLRNWACFHGDILALNFAKEKD